MSDRPKHPINRRQFLKMAGAATVGLLGKDAASVLGRGPRAAHAQEGSTGADYSVEKYLTSLDERLDFNALHDPVTMKLTEQGVREFVTNNGWDLYGDGTPRRPTPEMMTDALHDALQKGPTPYGPFDRRKIADYLIKKYGPANRAPGQNETETFFIKIGTDPATGADQYAVNTSDQWKEVIGVMVPMTIPFAELDAARPAPDQESATAGESPIDASGQTTTPVSESRVVPPVAAPEAPTVPMTPEQNAAKKLIAGLLGLGAAGLTLLGLGRLVGRKPKEPSAPSPLGQVRSDRTMTSPDRAQRVARNMANKRARYK